LAAVLLQFGFEIVEQGEGIGSATSESGNDLIVVEAAHLAGLALHDGVAKRDLAVAAERDEIATADGYDGGHVDLCVSDGSFTLHGGNWR
jgi:hypothetical protein